MKKKTFFKFRRGRYEFRAGFSKIVLGQTTRIMGVLNMTPDSFSDGGLYVKPQRALKRALEIQAEGGDIVDIGAESSRPGARPISAKEEIRRLGKALKIIASKVSIPISVDTTKYEVAVAAMDCGATVINDVNALRNNKRLAKAIAKNKAGVILMHRQGSALTMQENPSYADVVSEIKLFLRRSVEFALEAGISSDQIMIDPGFGFGKSVQHNIEILESLDLFSDLRYPVLAGVSRKSFIGNILGTGPSERLYGSLGAAAVAIERGAHVIRVHDVLAHRQLAQVMDRVLVYSHR